MNTQNQGVSGRGEGRIGIVKSTQILPLENTSVSLQTHQALFSKEWCPYWMEEGRM